GRDRARRRARAGRAGRGRRAPGAAAAAVAALPSDLGSARQGRHQGDAMTSTLRALLLITMALGARATVAAAAEAGAESGANAGRGPAAAPADGVRLRRFALMAGFNDGGPTRPQLRYAPTDARAMARVLESLGGVAAADVVFVTEPTRAAMLAALERLGRMVAAGRVAGVRREVVVYYSGHSDEEGLLIGPDRLSYDELRARIQAIPAEVRLGILDSCASGGFTRHKGGVRRP